MRGVRLKRGVVSEADILAEAARRFAPPPDILGASFGQQSAFIRDPARFKAALCTRRAGKSYGIGLSFAHEMLEHPGCSFLFMGLTRLSAKRILHKDIFEPINRQFGLGAKMNETTGDIVLPNRSTIYMLGGDSTPKEAEKALGSKLRGAVIDEGASFRQDLEHIVRAMIRPALVDLRGWLALIGTPGNHKGYFYRVTMGEVPGWSVHKWSARDNPHIREQWDEELAQLLAENPRIVETPLFKQHYLGEWAIDPSLRCYKYAPEVNDLAALPTKDGWHHVMALDLGYEDDTAIVVGAYREHDPTLYIVYAEKRRKLIIEKVAAWVREVRDRYKPHAMMVDASAKQAVEELRQRHRLPLEPAEKIGKADAIAMMSSDVQVGRVLVLPGARALGAEWLDLVWDEKALRERRVQVEHPSCPNHLADAALYMWRRATNYAARPAEKRRPQRPTTNEEADEEDDREAAEQAREEKRPWWDRL